MSRSTFLREVIEGAGFTDPAEANGFAQQVSARLAKGAAEYGDASKDRPVSELLAEAAEEGADIPGWCIQVLERIERDPEGHNELEVEHFKAMVLSANIHALKAWQELRLAALFWGPSEPKPVVVRIDVVHGGKPDEGTVAGQRAAA